MRIVCRRFLSIFPLNYGFLAVRCLLRIYYIPRDKSKGQNIFCNIRGVYRFLVGKPEGKRPLGDLDVDGWIILGWISRRWDVGMWTGLGWPRRGTGGGRL